MADKADDDHGTSERHHLGDPFCHLPAAGVKKFSTNSLLFLCHQRPSLYLHSCDDNSILLFARYQPLKSSPFFSAMSLKVVNLSKRYKDRWVLRGVSFEVEPGEVFGIFGPSSSGKSTLLNTIQGITPLNGGAIFFEGKEVTKSDRTALG